MKIKYILLCVIFSPIVLLSQEKLNELKAPSSPASGLLGLQPSAVLAPKSYQALETAIYSNFMTNSGPVIPNDFALEFTPYWIKNHGLTLQEYLYPTRKLDQVIRNSSFSIASTQNFLLGDSTASNALAFGYRTTFYFGNKTDRLRIDSLIKVKIIPHKIFSSIKTKVNYLLLQKPNPIVKSKAEFLDSIKSTVYDELHKYYCEDQTIKLWNDIVAASYTLPMINDSNNKDFAEQFLDIIDKNTNGDLIFNEFKSYIKKREGLSVDIAYANILNFPTSDFGLCFVPRQSVWITPTYQFNKNLDFLTVMGVLRYEWYNLNYYNKYFPVLNNYKENMDFGLAASAQFNKFSFQFEVVGRYSYSEIRAGTDSNGYELFRKENRSDLQYIGSFNYNLTDQIVLTYSIGNRFEPLLNPDHTLVSSLAINFGFGAPTKNELNFK